MDRTSTIGATMGRVLMIAAVSAAMLLALPAMAGAQEYPPPPTITVENPAVTVTIEGDDWEPGTEVTITRNDGTTQSASAQSTEVLAVAQTDSEGRFTADVSVPEGAELQLQAAGVGSAGEERVDEFVVTAGPDGATVSELPASGFPVWQGLAGVALVLLVLGGASVTVARRRANA